MTYVYHTECDTDELGYAELEIHYSVSSGRPARINCAPEDAHPEEYPEVEYTDIFKKTEFADGTPTKVDAWDEFFDWVEANIDDGDLLEKAVGEYD